MTGSESAHTAPGASIEQEVYVFPASFGQKRLWFLDQFEPNSPYYNIPAAFRLRGPFRPDVFQKAVDEIVARHESLRTTFAVVDGETVQVIHPEYKIQASLIDLQHLDHRDREQEIRKKAVKEARKPFDLKKGPLTRITVLKAAPDDHVVLLTMHHIISDGWSMGVLIGEISALYAAYSQNQPSPLPELPLQYADYAEWQKEYLQGEVLEKQLNYWKQHLGVNPPVLELPTDRPRPPVQTNAGATASITIEPSLAEAVKKAGQKEGATLFMTLLAAFKALLYRYTGQQSISVGTPIANRTQGETEGLIGLFINTLVLKTDIDPRESFRELLLKVRSTTLGAYENQDLPFEYLVDALQTERDIRTSPLFQVMFVLQNAPVNMGRVSDLEMEMIDVDMGAAAFDLTFNVAESPAGLSISAEYNTDLFNHSTIERLLQHYENLLRRISENFRAPVADIPFLTAAETENILHKWNDTAADFPQESCIHHLIEEQVARNGRAVAVIAGETQLDYAELNRRANQLAHTLIDAGAGPESRVGVCIERSAEMIVALLAILKAGAAYVPLDPNYPVERLQYMIDDAHIKVLVTQEKWRATFAREGLHTICVDADAGRIARADESNPDAPVLPDNAAYIIYTSGSTGKPKGVMISHRSVVNHNRFVIRRFDLQPDDRMLQFATINFDAAVEEIFPTLQHGAAVVLRGKDILISGSELSALIEDKGLTILDLPTAYWRQWVNELAEQERTVPSGLKLVILGGEKASPEHVARWYQLGGRKVRLLNTYGPTEATIICTSYEATADRNADDSPELPIGVAIANTKAYIADKNMQLCPVGVPGELLIGGVCLARGYLNRADLTAEKFIPDPFSGEPGARLYKTGDVVKYRADGNIEFVGRVDDQLKIRGFRVEPGEIENAILEHDDIRDVAVIARQQDGREKQLIAYLTAADGREPSPAELRRFLLRTLPEYMAPSAFVFLKEMPLTANGKIDRKALPDPDGEQILESSETEFVAPRTPSEEVVAEICAQVLGLEKVGVLHNFFELGGHSLLATQLISRVNKAFGVEVPLRRIFETPTAAGLARAVDEAKMQQAGIAAPPIERVSRDQQLPLSFAQHRLWFLDQLEPNSPFYNIPETYRIKGRLDIAVLEKSINEIIRRHEILRTTFGEKDGNPVLNIAQEYRYKLPVVDVGHLSEEEREQEVVRIARERMFQPIPLDTLPLFHLEIIRIAGDDHAIILIMHHIISDDWSSRVLMAEMAAIYAAFSEGLPNPLPELPIQYADYAWWQRNWLQGEVLQKQLDFWKRQLGDAPPVLALPLDRPRPAMQTFNGDFLKFTLPESVSEKIKKLSHQQGATLFMTLLAAFQALLHRYSGQDDISVGTPIANRNRTEVEGLIGFFVNTLVMRTKFDGAPSFAELIRRVKETAMDAYAHQELPFEKIVDAVQPQRDMSHSPLFQVMFVLQNSAGLSIKAGKQMPLQIEPLEAYSKTAKFDLTLFMQEDGDRLAGALEYNTDLFERRTIERMLRHFEALLTALAEQPDLPVAAAPMLTAGERKTLLLDWNGKPRAHHFNKTIVEIFEAQVKATPENPALQFGETVLSYAELNERANQLAHLLRLKGVGPDALVGVSIERSIDMIVALLAVLKAGGAYVPVDPSYPAERIRYILDDSGVALLLTTENVLQRFDERTPVLCLDRDRADYENMPATNPEAAILPENLAYMIYTSGSTGKPKGTLITHRGLTNYLNWTWNAYPLQKGRGSIVHSTIAFDATVTAVFTPLLSGKTIALIPDDADLEALAKALQQYKDFSVVKITPAHLEMLSHQIPPQKASGLTHAFVIGGENLTAEQIRFWRENAPGTLLFNEYGPTETVVGCVVFEASGWSGDGSVPIGRAIDNTSVYVLNEYLEPVPVGVPGELYISGEGVARGYHNRPDLTAERFLPDPFSGRQGARMYKTGDLVKYHADGKMEFLGRIDNQVKIRGYRIELGEIEAALAQHDKVVEAVVLAREDKPGDVRLVAYCKIDPDRSPTPAALRDFLMNDLPEYMLPSAFVLLKEFPLTANGKVDRRALPKPDYGDSVSETAFVAPRNGDEELLVEIFQDVLFVKDVGVFSNFFELGGHSLLATQLISRIRDAFKVELPLRALFEGPTAAALARRIEQERRRSRGQTAPPLTPQPRPDDLPLSFAQQRLWFLDRLSPDNPYYNIPAAVKLIGDLDVEALHKAVNEIVRRHESLRTIFKEKSGKPVQVVLPELVVDLPVIDLRDLDEGEREKEMMRLVTSDAMTPFQLDVAPLFRTSLIALGEDEYVITFTMHHIISDGWSTGVLLNEVGALYEAFHNGRQSPLPELPVQYVDYAIWQRNWLQGEVLAEQIDFWKQKIGVNPPVLDLPTDYPRPPVQTFNGDAVTLQLPKPLGDALQQLGKKHDATLFMTLVAAFQSLLHRYSRQDEIIIGSPIANRNFSETEALIGFFVNTLVLKADFSDAPTFSQLLTRVREFTLDAYAHQDVPFEQLVEVLEPDRDMSRAPIFQVMFVLQNTPRGGDSVETPSLRMEVIEAEARAAKFDLTVVMVESSDGYLVEFEYNTDLFARDTIQRMAGHFEKLLNLVSEDPNRSIADFVLVDEQEKHLLTRVWNDTKIDFPHICIHQLFEQRVQQTPDAVAVVCGDRRLTFAELNAQANRLARRLRDMGVKPETFVGISLEKSLEMIVGLLAVLKAGGVYIPIDPNYPRERIDYIITDAGIDILLTQKALLDRFDRYGMTTLALDDHSLENLTLDASNLQNLALPENLAYIIYTSGSTGKPKGTMLRHSSLVNLTIEQIKDFDLDESRRCLQFASFSFDASVSEIFTSLVSGARLYLAPREDIMPGPQLLDYLKRNRITTITLPPTALTVLPNEGLDDLRTLVSAGEACTREIAEEWAPNRQFINGYGPTENTVCASSCHLSDIPNRAVMPIGRPIGNVDLYVLDENMLLTPIGIPGELCIGGVGLARGYLNKPDLTAEKFIPNPFSAEPGERLYRTGDLVRYLPDGNLEFLGRIDHQVKLRGFRIELGEIEQTLLQHPGVRKAVVLVQPTEGDRQEKRLVAYIVSEKDEKVDNNDLRDYVQGKLPDYMAPQVFIHLEDLPLTPNGKIDRRALPLPSGADFQSGVDYVAPETRTQKKLADIWAKLLNVEQVGIRDNFFNIGGHSLNAVEMLALVDEAFHKRVNLVDFFRKPTIENLESLVERDDVVKDIIVRFKEEDDKPAVFFVHPSGGSVHWYSELAQNLAADSMFYGIQSEDFAHDDMTPRSIEDMATAYIRHIKKTRPQGPYHIGSWSMGVSIAYEIARQLSELGDEPGVLILLDQGPDYPGIVHRNDKEFVINLFQQKIKIEQELFDRMTYDQVIEYVFQKASKAKLISLDSSIVEFKRNIDILKNHTNAWIQYKPLRYRGRAALIKSAKNRHHGATKEDLGWGNLVVGGLDIYTVPGDHYSMMTRPHVKKLAKTIVSLIKGETG